MKVIFDRPGSEEIPDLAIALVPGVNEVSEAHGEILLARRQVRRLNEGTPAPESAPAPSKKKGA